MAVKPCLEPAPAVAHAVEDEHPAAPKPELLATSRIAIDRVHDPQAQRDEGEPDDATHDRVQPVGEERAEGERGQAERDDDGAVTQCIQGPEADRLRLTRQESRPAHGRPGREARRQRGSAGARVVGAHLVSATVAVDVSGHRQVLIGVGGLRDAGRRGRAGDVGDRRDMVPVDPVADPQQQAGDQDADAGGRWGGRDRGSDERFHEAGSFASSGQKRIG